MTFIEIAKEFSLLKEDQYNTIENFWDEISLLYGMENLQSLGYKLNNKIYYMIGLKKGKNKGNNF